MINPDHPYNPIDGQACWTCGMGKWAHRKQEKRRERIRTLIQKYVDAYGGYRQREVA